MKLYYYSWTFFCFVLLAISCQTSPQNLNEISPEFVKIDFVKKFDSLNIQLLPASAPVANYVNVVQTGNLLFLAGKGPKDINGQYIIGKIDTDLTVEQGYEAARATGIAQLSVLHDYLGDLNRVKQIVKVTGMVNATEKFTQHPEVVNGFSDLMVEVFGDKGKHARAAIGMNSLPRNIAVEIDMIVEIY